MIKQIHSPRTVRRARNAISAHHRNDTVVHGPPAHDTTRAPGRLVRSRMILSRLGLVIGGLLAGLVWSLTVTPAQAKVPDPVPPGTLQGTPLPVVQERISGLPLVPNFVKDAVAAIELGKSLFWDIQAGSDGQACASCHYHAGADNRIKNQLSPGLLGGNAVFDPTGSDGAIGPNYKLTRGDYPFHKLVDPGNNDSFVEFDTDDVTSSAGVSPSTFKDIVLGDAFDDCYVDGAGAGGDPVGFHVNGINVRRVEPRNTPTVINAVFNQRNFWDGRANNLFNGVDPGGRHNPDAYIFEVQDGTVVGIKVEFENSSLASQAVGPALSHFEMSCGGRSFAKLGKKMLSLVPLGSQLVHPYDSVLSALSNSPDPGLKTTYQDMIEDAFPERFWQSSVLFDANGNEIGFGSPVNTDQYTQTEINFSFFWGMAIQLYESTLVSDQSDFDKGLFTLTKKEQQGFDLFMGQGKCVLCHSTAMFTHASTLHLSPPPPHDTLDGPVERMLGGDAARGPALYDSGYYNIGVRPTFEDSGIGGAASLTKQYIQQLLGNEVPDPLVVNPCVFDAFFYPFSAGDLDGDGLDDPFPPGFVFNYARCNEPENPEYVDPEVYELQKDTIANLRTAVDGAFKVSTLRMTEFTGPYFHNGGQATLDEVVAFYNRGGDFPDQNAADLAPNIQPLGLTGRQQSALVAFLKSLTDDRVRCEAAPFDHPQFFVPNGHPGDEDEVVDDGRGAATDDFLELPAVGAGGRRAEAGMRCLLTFEEKLAAELFGYFDLRTATIEATLFGSRTGKTRNGLLSKLDSALAKVVLQNFEGAIIKLVDFQDQVESLLGSKKAKIDEDDGIGILALVADAIAALGAL